ncbi:DUF3667 domain-containing protein [Maricaulis sp.]|uniref:DUF3667 domain-containing protein n=1 Tax=Maricaulis sp. TaxID=1486257 RepID=UPI00262A7633|nr:DUF3667 domain-containing protein [Maricaulis sp.]
MSGSGSDQDQTAKPRDEQSRDALDSVTIAAFDVDSRIFRTMWHSLIRPNDVARSALSADYSRYLSPIRVFVALFSFQFAVAALFGAPIDFSFEAMMMGVPPDAGEAWLATGTPQPLSAREIDPALMGLMGALLWPITVVSSLPYLCMLKLYRPSVSWWGHVLLYLVPVNGSFLMMIGFLPLFPLFQDHANALFGLSTTLALVLYFILAGRVLAGFYARSSLGVTMRVIGLIAMLPITLLITMVMQMVAAFWLLNSEFGLSAAALFSLL